MKAISYIQQELRAGRHPNILISGYAGSFYLEDKNGSILDTTPPSFGSRDEAIRHRSKLLDQGLKRLNKGDSMIDPVDPPVSSYSTEFLKRLLGDPKMPRFTRTQVEAELKKRESGSGDRTRDDSTWVRDGVRNATVKAFDSWRKRHGVRDADREPDQSDLNSAARGLNMLGKSPAELEDIMKAHAGKEMFASKVIYLAAKQIRASKLRTGARDGDDYLFVVIKKGHIQWRTASGRTGSDPCGDDQSSRMDCIKKLVARFGVTRMQTEIRNESGDAKTGDDFLLRNARSTIRAHDPAARRRLDAMLAPMRSKVGDATVKAFDSWRKRRGVKDAEWYIVQLDAEDEDGKIIRNLTYRVMASTKSEAEMKAREKAKSPTMTPGEIKSARPEARSVVGDAAYEVVESKHWRTDKPKWEVVSTGYTVRNPHNGIVGIGRAPWKTRSEAEAWVKEHGQNAPRMGTGDSAFGPRETAEQAEANGNLADCFDAWKARRKRA